MRDDCENRKAMEQSESYVRRRETEMFENLEDVKHRYEEIVENLTIPEVVSDIAKYRKLIREQGELEPVYRAYLAFRRAEASETCLLYTSDAADD